MTAQVLSSTLEQLTGRVDLTREQAAEALRLIVEDDAGEAQAGAFLMGLRAKGETAEEIAGFAMTMRALALRVDVGDRRHLVDTAGTGGDGLGSFNISTAAAIVAAGAGARVAKHGNRAASSRCGSADVLEALGARPVLPPAGVARCIEEAGIGFMFAPAHHKATGCVARVRRSLGIRTIFNFLGPLTNPAGAARQIIGVGVDGYLEVLAEAVARLGCEHVLLVRGEDGLDEISLSGPTVAREVRGGSVSSPIRLEPEAYGMERRPLSEIRGGGPEENARIIRTVLRGAPGAPRDIVVLNTGATLFVAGVCSSVEQGVAAARQAIDSGAAARTLETFVALTNRIAAGAAPSSRTRAPARVAPAAAEPRAQASTPATPRSPATRAGVAPAGRATPLGRSSDGRTYLDRILPAVQARVAERKARLSLSELHRHDRPAGRSGFADAVRLPGMSVIAEIKRCSPSKGALRPDLVVCDLAAAYERAGARALSVLTEEDHFLGSLRDLADAVETTTLPILRKDFIIEEYQVYEAWAYGASAVLLIAAVLSPWRLEALSRLAQDLGLEVLLEIHAERELDKALNVKGAIIGINNRDLETFEVSLDTTAQLRPLVPADRLVVSESGIASVSDVARLAALGVDAVLVGETLLVSNDVEQTLADLAKESR